VGAATACRTPAALAGELSDGLPGPGADLGDKGSMPGALLSTCCFGFGRPATNTALYGLRGEAQDSSLAMPVGIPGCGRWGEAVPGVAATHWGAATSTVGPARGPGGCTWCPADV